MLRRLLICGLTCLAAATADANAADKRVDFESEVWPLLSGRCVACHGPVRQESGLRLDLRRGLESGGDTGADLLATPAEDGPFITRLTSDTLGSRMPPEGPWLTPAEVSLLAEWINQGAHWPEQAGAATFETGPGTFESWSIRARELTRHVRWVLVALMAGALVVLAIERRMKARQSVNRSVRLWYLIGSLVLLLVGLWAHHRGCERERSTEIARLEDELQSIRNPVAAADEFGPVPFRPRHPPRMQGEYFRGNDERHERLFNGGFYRTATFRIAVEDENTSPLAVGDAVPTGPIFLRFDMERAKGTTRLHFTEHAMSTVFLSNQSAQSGVTDEPLALDVIEPDWRWQVRYQLADKPAADDHIRGRVFVYCSASVSNSRINGRPHYGIEFDIRIRGGVIQPESEVWMGSLFQTEKVDQPAPGRIPVAEWFDFRAMPEIEGKNTDDPELLGLERPDGN